jgi:hypothetical protein
MSHDEAAGEALTGPWQVTPRPHNSKQSVRTEVGSAMPLKAGPGFQILAMRKSSGPDPTPGNLITVVPGEDPVLRGTEEQIKSWSASELMAIPVTISRNK